MKFVTSVLVLLGYFLYAKCEHFEIRSAFPGGACILFDIDADFNLTYINGNETENALFNLKGAKVAGGSSKCGNEIVGTTSVLSVNLFPSNELLMFTFTRQSGAVKMSARLTLVPRKHFKNLNQTGTVDMIDETDLDVGADTPNSFLCNSKETMAFRSTNSKHFFLTVALSKVHVQAYRIRNSRFSPTIECSQDQKSSTFEPGTMTTVHPANESTTEPHPQTTENNQNVTTEPIPETTTEPNTNTTTEYPPETTTNSSTDITTSPEMTSPEMTTSPGNESTTSGQAETTTMPEVDTTTPMVQTTTEPPNTQHKYVVRDGKEVCIVLQGDIKFEIPYQKKDGSSVKRNITIPDYVHVSGSCSYNNSHSAQEIILTFFNASWVLDIVVAKRRGLHEKSMQAPAPPNAEDYSWQALSLTYVIDANFPDAKHTGTKVRAVADGTFGKFKANTGGSYKCVAEQDLDFGKDNIKMDLTKLQYRAFGTTDSSDFSKTDVSECPADNSNTNGGGGHRTLAIALGCSLAGLVVIILIGYLLRLRKKRQELNGSQYKSIQ